jgi:hypothetical protein
MGLDLSAVMRQVYLWLAFGLVIAFGVSFVVGNTAVAAFNTAVGAGYSGRAAMTTSILFNPIVWLVSLVAYFALAFALQPIIMRARPAIGSLFYLLFTAVFGFMISSIFLAYRPGTIAMAFVATAGMFGAMSVIGYTTKIDLSRMGSLLMMGLIGIIIASVVNIFLNSAAIYWLVSYAGVVIFVGLTAYDTQWIKNQAASIAASGDAEAAQRIALIGAFHLFLDFMNLFLFILRILGGGRSRG